MKTIEYYIALPYHKELIADIEEGGYVVSFPDLRGCISSGETEELAVANANNAKQEWIAAALEDGCEIPEPAALDEYTG